jgi:hypothetical protein
MRDEHYRTQNVTKIVQPRGNVNGIIFAQHDLPWMGPLYSSTLKMEVCFSETSVDLHLTTRRYNPDDRT